VAGTGKRRRRRRRGRDRDRPPSQSSHDMEARSEPAHSTGAELVERQPALAVPEQAAERQPSASLASGEGSSNRKRRRRRRGGRRPGSESGLPGAQEHAARHEGTPAEISAAHAPVHTEDNGARTDFDTDLPVFLPNAPSEPVWSFSTDPQAPAVHREQLADPEPTIETALARVAETVAPTARRAQSEQMTESAPAAPAEPQATPGPPKRGWWQRPFRERG